MTAAAATGRTAFVDEIRAGAPAVAGALDAAFADLIAEALPELDDRLAALLGGDECASGARLSGQAGGNQAEARAEAEVVPLARPPRRAARRAVVVGGAVTAVLAATTGLAAASVLPAPVQRAVAEVASHVGLDLPTPRDDAVARIDPPATTAAPLAASPAAPPGAAVPAPSAEAPRTATSGNGSPAPTAPPASPPAADATTRAAFLAALGEFRACLRANGASGGQPRDCTPPDPADYGLAPAAEPADIAAFRKAYATYRACLRAGGGEGGHAACVRPDPAAYGLIVKPQPTAPSVPTATPPAGVEAFKRAVVVYVGCVAAARSADQHHACVVPDPRAFGLPGWPPGIRLPERSSATSGPTASSPPVNARPPARSPGATGTTVGRGDGSRHGNGSSPGR